MNLSKELRFDLKHAIAIVNHNYVNISSVEFGSYDIYADIELYEKMQCDIMPELITYMNINDINKELVLNTLKNEAYALDYKVSVYSIKKAYYTFHKFPVDRWPTVYVKSGLRKAINDLYSASDLDHYRQKCRQLTWKSLQKAEKALSSNEMDLFIMTTSEVFAKGILGFSHTMPSRTYIWLAASLSELKAELEKNF